jgi:hypothetical protein
MTTQFEYRLGNVPLGVTAIDRAYQRAVNGDLVEQIAAEFDPQLFGAIVVSERAGRFYVVDGQQRTSALQLRHTPADFLVPSVIHDGLTQEQEATMFVKINRLRRVVGTLDTHRANVVAKDERALAVEGILAHVGFSVVPPTKAALKHGQIRCIDKFLRAYDEARDRDVEDAFGVAVQVIWDAYHEAPAYLTSRWVKCILSFCISYHGYYEPVRLVGLLRHPDTNPAAIYSTAYNSVGGSSGWRLVVERLRQMYNEIYVSNQVVYRDPRSGGPGWRRPHH